MTRAALVWLALASIASAQPFSTQTDAQGRYQFPPTSVDAELIGAKQDASAGIGVTPADASVIMNIAAGNIKPTVEQSLICDADGNGIITPADAVWVLRLAAGSIQHLPISVRCGSDWIVWPVNNGVPPPGSCSPASLIMAGSTGTVNLRAAVYGDCNASWRP